MDAIIEFFKNGIALIFYGIIFIFGVFTLYGVLKGIVRKILKMMFTEENQMLTVIGYLIGAVVIGALFFSLITTLFVGYLIVKSYKEWWKK